MASYFVSSSGSNGNAGTQGSPWLTIAYALSNSVAGDTINLNGGNTFTENPSLTSGRTLQSYGTGQATITGGSSANTITITNCSGVTLSNLIITNAQTAEATACIWAYESSGSRYTGGLTISGCNITGGVQGIAILASSANNGGWNGIVISNNSISGCTGVGVWISEYPFGSSNVHFSNVLVSGNTIYNLPGTTGGSLSGGGAAGSGIILRNADSTTGTNAAMNYFSYNLIYNCAYNSTETSGGAAGMFPQNCNGCVMEYNIVHDMYATNLGVDGEGIDIDQYNSNVTSQYNLTYNNASAGQMVFNNTGNNVVRFNLSINDCTLSTSTAGSIWINGGSSAATVYNNTAIALGACPAMLFNPGSMANHQIYNNILVSAAGVPTVYAPAAFTSGDFEGNAYLSGASSFLNTISSNNYTSLAAWRIATGFETGSHGFSGAIAFAAAGGPPTWQPQSASPQWLAALATAYQLVANSPLVNAGLNLLSLYSVNPGTTDLVGNVLATPYSVGAINPGVNVYRRLLENGSRRQLQNLTFYRLLQATSEVTSGTGAMMMMLTNLASG